MNFENTNGVLLDTNVFIYIEDCDDSNPFKIATIDLLEKINDKVKMFHSLTIFREVSIAYDDIAEVKELFNDVGSELIDENEEIVFNAAKVYRDYLKDYKRRRKLGEDITKDSTIPNDLIIGSVAQYYLSSNSSSVKSRPLRRGSAS